MRDEQLQDEILRALEIDHQYVAYFEAAQTEQIALVRSLGRKAGRHLGWKIRTSQSTHSTRAGQMVSVVVIVISSTPDEEERLRERGELLIRNMNL